MTDQAPQYPAKSLARSIIIQFTHFSAAGAVGTLLHYAVLIWLVSGIDASPVTGTVLGATAGAITNYWLNRHYTFRSKRAHREAFPRFILMACLGILMNALIVGILTSYAAHYLIAQVFATLCVLILNYTVSRLWIFRPPEL